MKGVFLSRDGVINELVYHAETGRIEAPLTIEEFRLLPKAAEAIKLFKQSGLAVVVVSHQPGVARGQMSLEMSGYITSRMFELLAADGAAVDGVYYCFHHPEAQEPAYRLECECRKPKPGLLTKAAAEIGIDIADWIIIGDSIFDVMAGEAAGCRTVLLDSRKRGHARILGRGTSHRSPSNLYEAAQLLLRDATPKASGPIHRAKRVRTSAGVTAKLFLEDH